MFLVKIQIRRAQRYPRPEHTSQSEPSSRRHVEDHLAIVFLVIVSVFFICHLPRIILSIHEMWIVEITIQCARQGKYSFPIWAIIFNKFSHLLLVINSSMNCLIYCLMSSKFRKIFSQRAKKWGCLKSETAVNIEVVHVELPQQINNASKPEAREHSALQLRLGSLKV